MALESREGTRASRRVEEGLSRSLSGLVWQQGSQVSVGGARGSASLLSSQGRGIGPHDGLKKNSRCLSRAGGGARVTAGPKRPHLGVCPKLGVALESLQGLRDLT